VSPANSFRWEQTQLARTLTAWSYRRLKSGRCGGKLKGSTCGMLDAILSASNLEETALVEAVAA